MYASCLFCNSALGSNECIEQFPVGRRLAFDAATGRLWVVCPKCERWNLSPLETRWEAIEEAERAFRGTRMRVSTDNIGLCRLPDGTELVRIGKPLRPEFAAWRYGDQFLTRQRRYLTRTTAAAAGIGVLPVLAMQSQLTGMLGSYLLSAPLALGAIGVLAGGVNAWIRETRHSLSVRGAKEELLFLSPANAKAATLSPAGHAFEWQLNVPNIEIAYSGAVARALGVKERIVGKRMTYLRDADAKRVLATILPHVNMFGGGKADVQGAVELLDDAPSVHYLLHQASITENHWQRRIERAAHWEPSDSFARMRATRGERVKTFRVRSTRVSEIALGSLSASMRLALEMSVHEDDERKAMQGELAELERRWRDAEVIAKIADEMLTPEKVKVQLEEMREQKSL